MTAGWLTARTLSRTVPPAVPGIMFLSGAQSCLLLCALFWLAVLGLSCWLEAAVLRGCFVRRPLPHLREIPSTPLPLAAVTLQCLTAPARCPLCALRRRPV